MPDGVFITVEGIDGSGLSTQSQLIRDKIESWRETHRWVHQTNHKPPDEPLTVPTKEPTDGPAGGEVKKILSKRTTVDTETLALLFAADRRDHVEQLIQPMLDDGYIVISDRYRLSSYAYQIEGCDGGLEWLREINKHSITPDLTIIIDVDVGTFHQRRKQSRVTKELPEEKDFLTKARQNFLDIAEQLQSEGQNITIVNGEGHKEQDIWPRYKDDVLEVLRENGYFHP